MSEFRFSIVRIVLSVSNVESPGLSFVIKNHHQKLSSQTVIKIVEVDEVLVRNWRSKIEVKNKSKIEVKN